MSAAGSTTIKGPLFANGGIDCNNGLFNIEPNTGNTNIKGNVIIDNNLTISKDLNLNGNLSLQQGVFTVQDATGNTFINGTLDVNGNIIFRDVLEIKNSSNDTIIFLNTLSDGSSYFLGGNIGIGIKDPVEKLDVFGNINVADGYTYKINDVDVIFSQWIDYYDRDISFNRNDGAVYIRVSEDKISQAANSSALIIGNGDIEIIDDGTLILKGQTFDDRVTSLIPKSVWNNNPEGSTVENGDINSIYTSYIVQTAKHMAISTSPYEDADGTVLKQHTLSVSGSINLEDDGDLYFNNVKLEVNVWQYWDNPNSQNDIAKYIYFSTDNDPFPSLSYVGIGTSKPEYNLHVKGDINIEGTLLLGGKAIIFPDPDQEDDVVIADWQTISSTDAAGTTITNLYYQQGNICIGSQIPSTLLHLEGDGEMLSIRAEKDKSLSYLTFYQNSTSLMGMIGFVDNSNSNQLVIKNMNSDGSLLMSNLNGTGELFISSSGKTGIGTINPVEYLHVNGSTRIEGDIKITGGNGKNLKINNSNNKADDENERIALQHASGDILKIDPDHYYTGGIELGQFGYIKKTTTSGGVNYIRMGLLNSNPNYTLDVSGDINFTGVLYKNDVEQFPSSWYPTDNNGSDQQYLIYPRIPNESFEYKVGIGTGSQGDALPQAMLDIFDKTVYNLYEYDPNFIITSSINTNVNSESGAHRGVTIELNYFDTEEKLFYKGIRLHTVTSKTDSDTFNTKSGFAIDTNSGSDTDPFVNLFHLNNKGYLGLGNFLEYNGALEREVSGKLHIINTDNVPSLIITNDITNSNIATSSRDMYVINSNDDGNNLGYFTQIFGVNIQPNIDNTNAVVQNEKVEPSGEGAEQNSIANGVNGASAFYVSSNGGLSYAVDDQKTAFGVLTTNSFTNNTGQTLDEVFSISKVGNITIRTDFNNTTRKDYSGKFGLDLRANNNLAENTNDRTLSGSINVAEGCNYYVDGKLIPLPWEYDILAATGNGIVYNYDTSFSAKIVGEDIPAPPLTTAGATAWEANNVVQEIDSRVGIGLTNPRGALDVAGPIYSRYGVLGSNSQSDNGDFAIQHVLCENTNNDSYNLLCKPNGSTHVNSYNKVKITYMGSDDMVVFDGLGQTIDFYKYINTHKDVNILSNMSVNGTADFHGSVICDNTLTCSELNVIGNMNLQGGISASGDITSGGNIYANSDIRLKTNILPIENSLDKINQLQGVYFNKKNKSKREIGLIAQEVEKIIPEVVIEDNDEEKIKSVCYGNLSSVLIEAIKELTQQNKELLKRIEKLEN